MPRLSTQFAIIALAIALALPAMADSLLSRRVVERLELRTVEVLCDGLIRGGGGIVSKSGRVVTAAHLLSGPDVAIEVIVPTLGRRAATLVAVDLGRDLALLQIDLREGEKLDALDVANGTPRRSERIFCFGPALRNQPLLLTGMVSEDRETCAEYAAFDAYLQCYLVDAAAPSLMSGSVWVDDDGDVVGIQNGRLNDDGGQGAGIALVATPEAIRALMLAGRDARTPGIGAWGWELWTAAKAHVDRHPKGQEGIIITFLRSKGPLDQAGIKLHDVVTHVDEIPVTRRSEFIRIIRGHQPGKRLTMRVLKGDNVERTYTVTLEDVAGRWRNSGK